MPSIPFTKESRLVHETTIERNGIDIHLELRRVIDSEPSWLPLRRSERKYHKVNYRIHKEGNLLGGKHGSIEIDGEDIDDQDLTADKVAQHIEDELDRATKEEKSVREEMDETRPLVEKIGDRLRK